MSNTNAATITQADFWNLPQVVAAQNEQKENPFWSERHRNAHIVILDLAAMYGVEENFESLEEYDNSKVA